MKKQIETWKKAGGRVLLHSCGNIDAILEDLADMGIDAINNIQVRAGMDLASTKKRIGDRVTIDHDLPGWLLDNGSFLLLVLPSMQYHGLTA